VNQERLAGISLRRASAVTKVMADKTARQALAPPVISFSLLEAKGQHDNNPLEFSRICDYLTA
jgi:hypothetical protein